MSASPAAARKSNNTKATRATSTTTEVVTSNIVSFETASLRRLREFAASLPGEFLECRQFGHAWTAHTVGKTRGTYTVTITCMRCTSTATETLDRDGNRDGKRRIHYVEGYLSHGMGRLTGRARSVVRLETVSRLS